AESSPYSNKYTQYYTALAPKGRFWGTVAVNCGMFSPPCIFARPGSSNSQSETWRSLRRDHHSQISCKPESLYHSPTSHNKNLPFEALYRSYRDKGRSSALHNYLRTFEKAREHVDIDPF